MRILLSEGSGLTSRQVATRLGDLGHHVEIVSSSRVCLTRFTRHVRKLHLVPRLGDKPLAWLKAANAIANARAIDLLFPTQEQVAVLSARQQALNVATVAPPFQSLRRVQDKISAYRALQEIGVPQPESVIVGNLDDLGRVTNFPVFVKRPISTASSGVCRVSSRAELETTAKAMGLGDRELLVQSQSSGPLAMVQAVADNGRLVAHHANLRLREGLGGGASLKESMELPSIVAILEKLVGALNWHGALSMDVIVTHEGPVVIDVNPRLVEPMNAYIAGVDLVSAMLDIAHSRTSGHAACRETGRPFPPALACHPWGGGTPCIEGRDHTRAGLRTLPARRICERRRRIDADLWRSNSGRSRHCSRPAHAASTIALAGLSLRRGRVICTYPRCLGRNTFDRLDRRDRCGGLR